MSIGSWFGIPVNLHWSWLLWIAVAGALDYQIALMFLGISLVVYLHELGHCFVAKIYGFKTEVIYLTPIGGMAMIDLDEDRLCPKSEFLIAVAGPAVNLALIPVLYAVSDKGVLGIVFWLNVSMLVFNLFPAFPMDGGRLFRAYRWHRCKSYQLGTHSALEISRICAGILFLLAIWQGMPGVGVIALLLIFSANQAN